MESPLCIGVVGHLPESASAPVRLGQVSRMTALGLEPAASSAVRHPAIHTAVHALMNGIPRVVISPVLDDRWDDALTALLSIECPPVVVIPGDLELSVLRPLVQQFLASDAGCLWLDAPSIVPAEVIQFRRRIQAPTHRLRLALPAIRGLTPGRPGSETLPASAVIGPLHLGTVSTLKGTFEPPPPNPALDDLKRIGCGVLAAHGYQRRLGLAFPLSRPARQEQTAIDDLPSRIRGALREATDPHFDGRPDSMGFRAALERSVRVVLAEFQRRGDITSFYVHIVDGHDGPDIDIGYRTPKRITDVTIRLTQT